MSALTSPCQVHFPGLSLRLGGKQQPCFCGVGIGERREVTAWVSVLVDPFFMKATTGPTHRESNHPNQPRYPPRAFCLDPVSRLRHVFRYCHHGNGDGWVSHSLICESAEFTFAINMSYDQIGNERVSFGPVPNVYLDQWQTLTTHLLRKSSLCCRFTLVWWFCNRPAASLNWWRHVQLIWAGHIRAKYFLLPWFPLIHLRI